AWTQGETHISGVLTSKSAKALAELTGFKLVGDAASPLRLSLSSTGVAQDGMALTSDIDTLGAQAQFAGTLAVDSARKMKIDGRLAILGERAQQLYTALGLSDGGLSPAAQVLSGEGEFKYGEGQWTYKGVRGTAVGAAYRGDFSLNVAGERPQFEGELTTGALHLPWLMRLALMTRDGSNPNAAASFDTNGGLPGDIDFKLKVGELSIMPGVELKDASVGLKQADDTIALAVDGIGDASAPFDAEVQFRRREVELEANGKISGGFELYNLLRSVDGHVPIAGQIDLSATLSGSGRSPSGLIAGLTGEGTYELKAPELSHVSPLKFASGLQDLNDANDLDRLVATVLFDGQMPFAGSEGKLVIDNGVVELAKIPVTAEGATGHLRTLFEFSSGQIDISARLQLDALEGLPAFEVAYSGHPRALERTRDLAALKSFIGVNVLQKGLDKLEELQR
ncbi:MAG: AsmA-like C-terminal region-containing protein, partial [Aestuariivirgaceae bacterium]